MSNRYTYHCKIPKNSSYTFQIKFNYFWANEVELTYIMFKENKMYKKNVVWVERDFTKRIETDLPENIKHVDISYEYYGKNLNATVKNNTSETVCVYLKTHIQHYDFSTI